MKMPDLELILMKYAKEVIMPVIPNPLTKFALISASTLMLGKTERLMQQYLPILQTLEVISQEGDINVEALYKAAKEGIKATGGKLEIKGLIFNEQDIDNLYYMMRGQ